ncbi:hypothetical protein GGX14DRAFT_439944 [Mycena pura]|uniref:Telomere replication protein EST3 n=1 Tax=Mycena pura TaxID=153505 RepID=A0AAD6YK42_9AGAR|nr:hypothetical protein GGX14DRAFT_439944 [Mycena pura]
MSESIRPWIRDYLISVAETHGANLSAASLQEKGKKVQIIEFLTFGAENEDSAIWATIHDKYMAVPIKFSKDAVAACYKSLGRRMTESRTALVIVKKFRPTSTRVPSRNGGMSSESFIALQCDSVQLVGSFGEGKWGNPQNVESDPELHDWSLGLRQDGGAGNVLKERKKAREANKGDCPSLAKRPVTPRKLFVAETKPQATTSKFVQSPTAMHTYSKRWRTTLANPLDFVRPATPPRLASPEREDARDLGLSSPSQKYSAPSSPISGWSPTPTKSSAMEGEVSRPPSPSLQKDTSYLSAPTPAQRRVRSPGSNDKSPSPFPMGAPTLTPAPISRRSLTSQLVNHDSPSQIRGQRRSRSPGVLSNEADSPKSASSAAPAPASSAPFSTAPMSAQRRRPSSLHSREEWARPAKKRRLNNDVRGKLDGFRLNLNDVKRTGRSAVGWEQWLAVVKVGV